MFTTSNRRGVEDRSIIERLKRFSVAEYHQSIKVGMLTPDHPVELLEGFIIETMPILPSHRFTTDEVRRILIDIVSNGYFVSGQQPVTLADSEPEPDCFVVRGTSRDYLAAHPGPNDVPIVIEVSDSTLTTDQGIKKRVYARANIPAYWIVNLVDRQLECYVQPISDIEHPTYRTQTIYTVKDVVPVIIDGQTVGEFNLSDILP